MIENKYLQKIQRQMTPEKWQRKLDAIERILKRQLVKTYSYQPNAVQSMARQLDQIATDRQKTTLTLADLDRYWG